MNNVPSVKLIDGHLPDPVGPAGTVLGVTVALVRHSETKKQYQFIFLYCLNKKITPTLLENALSVIYIIKETYPII